jgi:hypothetical protein
MSVPGSTHQPSAVAPPDGGAVHGAAPTEHQPGGVDAEAGTAIRTAAEAKRPAMTIRVKARMATR